MSYFPEEFKTNSGDGAANYVKIKEGEYRFRILSPPIIGWLDWTLDRKPLRFLYNAKPKPINADRPVRQFVTMIVWDYADQNIKIWEITQKKIMNALQELTNSSDWGAPFFYDIKIVRTGTELENTTYAVIPVPPKPLHPMIEEEFAKKRCNLEALFEGKDPWDVGAYSAFTKGVFSPADVKSRSQEAEGVLLDKISKKVIAQGGDPGMLAIYIGQKSADKRRTFTEVAESALHEDFLPAFISQYKSWCSSMQSKNAPSEEIPF